MDIVNVLLGSLQLGIAAIQLKLDHFSKRRINEINDHQRKEFVSLGEAIRILEYALGETIAFIGQNEDREPNPRLANLWRQASESLRAVEDASELANITFEKNLYWRNPEFFANRNDFELYRISLENVLLQVGQLHRKNDRLLRRLNANQ